MKRYLITAICCAALSGCDLITDLTNAGPNVDGSYLGDFQSDGTLWYDASGNGTGNWQTKPYHITGAVGFTIQGTKVITTKWAGEGVAVWDSVNRYWWIDFDSILSTSATACHQFHYTGVLSEKDGFIRVDGQMSCTKPAENFAGGKHIFYAKRQ